MAESLVIAGTLAGVLVGGFVQYVTGRLRDRETRRYAIADRLREERRTAYTDLLTSARRSAHLLARATSHQYGSPLDAAGRAEAAYFYDVEVVPRLTVTSVIGTDEAVSAAWEMGVRLERFREYVTTGELKRYRSDEYNEVYDSYRNARDSFTELVRVELVAKGA